MLRIKRYKIFCLGFTYGADQALHSVSISCLSGAVLELTPIRFRDDDGGPLDRRAVKTT